MRYSAKQGKFQNLNGSSYKGAERDTSEISLGRLEERINCTKEIQDPHRSSIVYHAGHAKRVVKFYIVFHSFTSYPFPTMEWSQGQIWSVR